MHYQTPAVGIERRVMATDGPLGVLAGKDLAVFDLDGTLYDDRTYLRAADRAIAADLAATYGLDGAEVMATLDEVLADTGRHEFLTNLVDRLDLPDPRQAAIDGGLRQLRQVDAVVALFPWADRLLRDLAAGGTAVAVLTNGNRQQQVNKVTLLGLDDPGYPLTVVYTVDHRQKPAPDGLLHLLRATGVPADRAVMVGNDAVDRDCAAACRVDYVDVTDLVAALSARGPELAL